MGILKLIFIVLLLLFPLGAVVRFELTNGAFATVNDLTLAIFVVFLLIIHLQERYKFKKTVLGKPILIFAGIGLISLILGSTSLAAWEFFVSFLYLLRWLLYAAVYFIIIEFDRDFKKKIPFLMFFSGSIILLIGYVQYFLYPNLRNLYYLGWDEHLYRMFSSFLDPNFAGAFFVLYLILVLGLLFESFKNKINFNNVLFAVICVATFLAVYLTYSRSAFFMLIVGILAFLIIKKKAIIGLLLIIVFIATPFFMPKAFKTEGTNLLRIASSESRVESFQKALIIFKENPILGVGFNSYRYAQKHYGFLGKGGETSHAGGGTDNSFLFVLATTGILGFMAYLFIWIKILVSSYRQGKKGSILSQILFSSSIALLFDSLFINSLFYIFFMLWMWILVGLTENK